MSQAAKESTRQPRSTGIRDRGVTIDRDAGLYTHVVAPLRRYIPVTWFDWQPHMTRPKSWWPDLFLVMGLVLSTVLLMGPDSILAKWDMEIRVWSFDHKIEWLRELSIEVTSLGSGRFIAPIVLIPAVWAALRARSIRPLLMYVLCYIPLSLILASKHIFGRPLSQYVFPLQEHYPDGAPLFEYSDVGGGGIIEGATAYPSGHAANAIVWYALLVMLIGGLLKRWMVWTILVAPAVLVISTQTYAGRHWLFDAPAGIMMGLLIIRAARRVPWHTVPLGPLEVFEPATRKTILYATLLISGLLLTAVMPLYPGIAWASSIIILSFTWLIVEHRKARRKAREAALSED
ncbi:phosphatase PAP2 family protein [Salininema proteolyticum]|uniref:Phosphatase PAP2 family protein n=1 Tax=Salininema proteolyticum TaxID=1607685 RepID=A0ABV8TT71_9ACTN